MDENIFPILVVEDDPVTRRLLFKILARAGHRVTEAENGKIAIEILKTSFFPIIVTDWMMPEMDGLQLCRQVRERENAGYVYIILLTAKDSQEDIIKGFETGAEVSLRGKSYIHGYLYDLLATGEQLGGFL